MIQLLPVLLIVLAIGCAYWWVKRETQRRYELFDSDSTIEVPKKVTLDEQIRISKKELETVFDAITEAICIIDKKFTIIRVNKSYAALVGQPIKKLLGKHCYQTLWKRDSICSDCPASGTFLSGEVVVRKGIRVKEADENKFFEMKTYPVSDETGRVVHVIEFTREVTDEKRISEQLIRSEKLASIGIMTAGIAHEMNNPLSGISGMAVNLLEMPQKYGLNERGIERVRAILDSSARATSIMRDLLYLSRKADSTSVLISINSLIIKAVEVIHYPGMSEIHQRFNFEKSLPLIHCDPAKIEQVIINVISNAVQSILEKKQICLQNNISFSGLLLISTQLQDEENILITISDNGTGIPEANRSRIFDPFFSTRPPGQGTGLGLSISHKIIEEHGGRIFFDCIDDVTVFSIVLPIERKGYY
ncbi:MAG: PAS domain-containing protein [Fibrobacter sp.]|jgi:two-component system NtrC family sensor kinase|nr:PAS domain-containing protein [Fibrobacter sp.]